MRIVITGGAGFIGSHIVEHYCRNHEVVVIDNLRTGYKKNVEKFNIKFVKGSVENYNLVYTSLSGADYVFHLAALVSVPESIKNPVLTENINVIGTLNILNAAVKQKVKKVIFISSAAIYGNNPIIRKKEDMLPEPRSPYAITKLSGEYYCNMYKENYGLKTSVVRFFNVFGPRQDPTSQYAAVIPIFTSNAINRTALKIFGDGKQTRDFIYVKDVVTAISLVADKGIGVYNIGLGKSVTINKLAKNIIKITNSTSKIEYTKEREGDVKHSVADITKLKSLGFVNKTDFEDSLKKTVDYFRLCF